jgi:hypothetical protein
MCPGWDRRNIRPRPIETLRSSADRRYTAVVMIVNRGGVSAVRSRRLSSAVVRTESGAVSQ